MTIILTFIIK